MTIEELIAQEEADRKEFEAQTIVDGYTIETLRNRSTGKSTHERKSTMRLRIESIASHRNGVSGAPFHAVLFWLKEEGEAKRYMLATVFDEPGHVAVLDVFQANAGDIAFASNSWRGDVFEADLRSAIQTWDDEQAARYLADFADRLHQNSQ